ncbi:hypothetical protein NQ318_013969, partial [Aromia moschata]
MAENLHQEYSTHLKQWQLPATSSRCIRTQWVKRQFQGDKHEAYVRLTLNQHYRAVKEKRTGIAKPSRDNNVTFAEGFNFKLTPPKWTSPVWPSTYSSLHLVMVG